MLTQEETLFIEFSKDNIDAINETSNFFQTLNTTRALTFDFFLNRYDIDTDKDFYAKMNTHLEKLRNDALSHSDFSHLKKLTLAVKTVSGEEIEADNFMEKCFQLITTINEKKTITALTIDCPKIIFDENYCIHRHISKILEKSPFLNTLTLNNSYISHNEQIAITTALKNHSNITSLFLNFSEIDGSFNTINEILENSTLTEAHIAYNISEEPNDSMPSFQKLGKTIQSHSNLRKLTLTLSGDFLPLTECNPVDYQSYNEMFKNFFEALSKNPHLTDLIIAMDLPLITPMDERTPRTIINAKICYIDPIIKIFSQNRTLTHLEINPVSNYAPNCEPLYETMNRAFNNHCAQNKQINNFLNTNSAYQKALATYSLCKTLNRGKIKETLHTMLYETDTTRRNTY